MKKPYTINQDKMVKPCVFIGSFGSFMVLFVFGAMHGYAITQERIYAGQIQWYYPEVGSVTFTGHFFSVTFRDTKN